MVASSSGRSQSIARLRSRIGTEPSTMHGAVGQRAHALDDDIVLVGDVADDFLENILERDEAHDDAIFVDDEGEMRLALQERLELLLHRRGFRHEPGFERDRFRP